jgi:mono/diheme cytochrome c family protein
MRHKGWVIVGIIIALALVLAGYGVSRASISALPEPGPVETFLATKTKDWFIRRAARGPLPPAPPNDTSSVSAGGVLFGMACASCHGRDGRTPTPIGRSMYPRALDLSSHEVQRLSDQQLFWIIRNGIRLSGMPGFARINTNDQIWQLTYYVRRLGKHPRQ